MSYIQQFLSQHLPQYYLTTVTTRLSDPNFFNPTVPNNIFDLTFEISTFSSIRSVASMRDWFGGLLSREFSIPYDCLRNFSLPGSEADGEIVRLMKGSMSYVQVLMLQLELRLLQVFLECEEEETVKTSTLSLLEDVKNIYPILKTEISINFDSIPLNKFMEDNLLRMTSSSNSHATIQALSKIKNVCHFTGGLQRFIDHLCQEKRKNTQLVKHPDFSSNESEEESRINQTQTVSFNQAELFRKKKPKNPSQQAVTALKSTKSISTIEATPIVKKKFEFRRTPRTDRNELINKDQGQSLKKTPLLKKIKKQIKKPLERTIYHAEIKKFVPKKGNISEDIFSIKESLTSGVSFQHFSFFESTKKTSKKSACIQEEEELSAFCVPETPRIHIQKKTVSRRFV